MPEHAGLSWRNSAGWPRVVLTETAIDNMIGEVAIKAAEETSRSKLRFRIGTAGLVPSIPQPKSDFGSLPSRASHTIFPHANLSTFPGSQGVR